MIVIIYFISWISLYDFQQNMLVIKLSNKVQKLIVSSILRVLSVFYLEQKAMTNEVA